MDSAGGDRWRVLRMLVLGVLLAASIVPRVMHARLGHNHDMEAWQEVARLVRDGRNVYAETARYNYGPVWMQILAGLSWLHEKTARDPHAAESFHMYVAAFLGVVDVAIAILLAWRFNAVAALIFAYCPVSVLISGFHSQFDNIAVLLGMASWFLLVPIESPEPLAGNPEPSWKRTILVAIIFAASLATKHIFVFLPLWFLMNRKPMRPPRALAFTAIALGLFAASFLPFAQTAEGRGGIVNNVMNYRSQIGDKALFVRVLDLFFPYTLLDLPHRLWRFVPSGLMLTFAAAVMVAGRFAARRRTSAMIWDYLLVVVAFSVAWAEQYLAIPLVACVALRRHAAAWLFILAATGTLILSPVYFRVLGGTDLLFDLFANRPLLFYHASIWLLLLLFRGSLPNIRRYFVGQARSLFTQRGS